MCHFSWERSEFCYFFSQNINGKLYWYCFCLVFSLILKFRKRSGFKNTYLGKAINESFRKMKKELSCYVEGISSSHGKQARREIGYTFCNLYIKYNFIHDFPHFFVPKY